MASTKLSKEISDKIGLYILAAVVALIALWFLFFSQKLAQNDEINLQKEVVQTEIDDLEKLQLATEQLKANFTDVVAERDRILALLPVDADEDRLLALLSRIQKESGVVLASFSPEYNQSPEAEALGAAGIGSYSARINFTGSYDQINSFLSIMGNSARFIDVESYTIGGGASDTNPELEANFTINSYFQQSSSITDGGGIDG